VSYCSTPATGKNPFPVQLNNNNTSNINNIDFYQIRGSSLGSMASWTFVWQSEIKILASFLVLSTRCKTRTPYVRVHIYII
jgi:hypothetical protein